MVEIRAILDNFRKKYYKIIIHNYYLVYFKGRPLLNNILTTQYEFKKK